MGEKKQPSADSKTQSTQRNIYKLVKAHMNKTFACYKSQSTHEENVYRRVKTHINKTSAGYTSQSTHEQSGASLLTEWRVQSSDNFLYIFFIPERDVKLPMSAPLVVSYSAI